MMENLKLNALSKKALSEREMNSFSGGNVCGCACSTADTVDNGTANHAGNKNSQDKSENYSYYLDEVVVTP